MAKAKKIKEFRDLSDDQLQFALTEAQQGLFHLRFHATTDKTDSPSQMRVLRRDIARLKTIQRQRELEQLAQAAAVPAPTPAG